MAIYGQNNDRIQKHKINALIQTTIDDILKNI